MKRFISLIAATAALGLAGSASALGPEDQAGAAPSTTAEPSTVPSPEQAPPSTMSPQSEVSAAAQSSPSTAQNTRLAAIVPAGMTTQEACTGFRSVDECAAALHASQNLGLSFTDLKAKVTGGQKLGEAIKELKPGANIKAEVRKAEEQARADTRSPQG